MKILVTPQCPKCHSLKTGYYIAACPDFNQIKQKKFLKGERVRQASFLAGHKTCYCQECNFEWNAILVKARMNQEQFQKHLSERGFLEERNVVIEKRLQIKRPESEPEEKEENNRGFIKKFAMVLLIVTGIDIRKAAESFVTEENNEQK